jgi:pimeloyl-ACP methyl ester carboxylesterase
MKTEDLSEVSHSSNVALDDAADELGWQVVNPNLIALKRIDIGDVELTYLERGKGPLVVMVHGALGDCRTWSRLGSLLAQQYRVVSYSRRYHHLSPSPQGKIDYSYRQHVDDLIELIRALGLGPAHLVGHSYGATVAALVALERPEMVSSLVLGEPSLFSILSDSQDRLSLRFHRIALRVVQKLCENDEQALAVREYLNIVVGQDVYDKLPLEDLLVINQNAYTLGPMLRTYFEPTKLDRTGAQKLTTPTLLITGELSPGIYGAITRELNNYLPTAQSFILPGASHGLQKENHEGFGVALLNFLSNNQTDLSGKNC